MATEAVTVSAAVVRVMTALAQQRDQLVAHVVTQAQDIDSYSRLGAAELADVAETVGGGFDAVLRAMAEQRSFSDEDVRFVTPHIRRRTRAGVTEAEMLAVVRLFQRTLWDAIAELGEQEGDGREAAFILARPLIDYTDVLSRVVTDAFAEAREAFALRANAVNRDLVDTLLAGREPSPGPLLNAARACGLVNGSSLVLVVARPAGRVDAGALAAAARALARTAGDATEPLVVLRGEEIVVVRAIREQDSAALAEGLVAAQERLAQEGLLLAVGISTVHDGTAFVPAAYEEACVAVERVRETGGLVDLGSLSLVDYLILRAGDDTAWRLVPAPVRSFVEEDARQGGTLRDAVITYVESDLNVKLAAERLFVHPNTAHYRLSRVEERTGLSVRRFEDLLVLLLAFRLGDA